MDHYFFVCHYAQELEQEGLLSIFIIKWQAPAQVRVRVPSEAGRSEDRVGAAKPTERIVST